MGEDKKKIARTKTRGLLGGTAHVEDLFSTRWNTRFTKGAGRVKGWP